MWVHSDECPTDDLVIGVNNPPGAIPYCDYIFLVDEIPAKGNATEIRISNKGRRALCKPNGIVIDMIPERPNRPLIEDNRITLGWPPTTSKAILTAVLFRSTEIDLVGCDVGNLTGPTRSHIGHHIGVEEVGQLDRFTTAPEVVYNDYDNRKFTKRKKRIEQTAQIVQNDYGIDIVNRSPYYTFEHIPNKPLDTIE